MLDADEAVAEASRLVASGVSAQTGGAQAVRPSLPRPQITGGQDPWSVLVDPRVQAEFRALGAAAAVEVEQDMRDRVEVQAAREMPLLVAAGAAAAVVYRRGLTWSEVIAAAALGWVVGRAAHRTGLLAPEPPPTPAYPPLETLELLRATRPQADRYLDEFLWGWSAARGNGRTARSQAHRRQQLPSWGLNDPTHRFTRGLLP